MAQKSHKESHGLILGKFHPPHLGHLFLINRAREICPKLTIILGSLKRETIPGKIRHKWLREIYPDLTILHLQDENPQKPAEHPDFWNIWLQSIRRLVPRGPDLVFSSELYGDKLAQILRAKHIMVDLARIHFPISGTLIRKNPYKYWDYIPKPVQSHYVKRIAIVGAESTGKTTLAEKLARHFNTAWVPEFARIYLDQKNAGKNAINVAEKDFPIIARGQLRSEEKMARYAQKILFCDTEVRTTAFWSEIFLGHCPDIVSKLALKKQYDLYLLTTNDVPWTNDPQRNHRHLRDAFFHNWHKELDSMNANYTLLSGAYQQRFQQASKAVNSLFKKFPSALKKNLII